MILLQTILEVFHRSLIRIGREMSFKLLHNVMGSYLTQTAHTFSQQFVFTKKILLCKETNYDPRYYDSFNI